MKHAGAAVQLALAEAERRKSLRKRKPKGGRTTVKTKPPTRYWCETHQTMHERP